MSVACHAALNHASPTCFEHRIPHTVAEQILAHSSCHSPCQICVNCYLSHRCYLFYTSSPLAFCGRSATTASLLHRRRRPFTASTSTHRCLSTTAVRSPRSFDSIAFTPRRLYAASSPPPRHCCCLFTATTTSLPSPLPRTGTFYSAYLFTLPILHRRRACITAEVSSPPQSLHRCHLPSLSPHPFYA